MNTVHSFIFLPERNIIDIYTKKILLQKEVRPAICVIAEMTEIFSVVTNKTKIPEMSGIFLITFFNVVQNQK